MHKSVVSPRDVNQSHWIEIGGVLYQVEKPVEANDYGDFVIHLRHDPAKAADIILIISQLVKLEVHTEM